jgi:hypothetical protein
MISDNMLCAGYPEGMKDSCQVSWQLIDYKLDIHGSVHHDTIYENDQQDATV